MATILSPAFILPVLSAKVPGKTFTIRLPFLENPSFSLLFLVSDTVYSNVSKNRFLYSGIMGWRHNQSFDDLRISQIQITWAASTVNSFLMMRTISTALRSACTHIIITIAPFITRRCISKSRGSTFKTFPRTCET